MEATAWGRRPTHLIRDRDRVYGGAFRHRTKALGIDEVLTPVRAPQANAVAERLIGTLRRDCLDHVIAVDERHLGTVLAEYVRYYNTERPHRTLRLETPQPAALSPPARWSRGRYSGADTTCTRVPREEG